MESSSFPITITTNIAAYKYTVNVTDDMNFKEVKDLLLSHSDWNGWARDDINLYHMPTRSRPATGFFLDD